MNIQEAFEFLMKREIKNLKLTNRDGATFLQHVLNKGQMANFKVTINHEPGKTLIEKI